jgi:hypothetical protein
MSDSNRTDSASDAQESQWVDGMRLAAIIADQMVDRQKLLQAIPSVLTLLGDPQTGEVIQLDSFDQKDKNEKAQHLDKLLASIWAPNTRILDIEEEFVHERFNDIKIFEIESASFERFVTVNMQHALLRDSARSKSTEWLEGENGEAIEAENASEDGVVLITKRIALRYNKSQGQFSDDEMDASFSAELFFSENLEQMQAFIRSAWPFQSISREELESELQRIYQNDHVDHDMPTRRTPKP